MSKCSRSRIRNAFTSLSDIFHAILGFIACLVNVLPYGWIVSLIITLIFTVYEALEAETPAESYHDLIEFLVGFALALPLLFSGR